MYEIVICRDSSHLYDVRRRRYVWCIAPGAMITLVRKSSFSESSHFGKCCPCCIRQYCEREWLKPLHVLQKTFNFYLCTDVSIYRAGIGAGYRGGARTSQHKKNDNYFKKRTLPYSLYAISYHIYPVGSLAQTPIRVPPGTATTGGQYHENKREGMRLPRIWSNPKQMSPPPVRRASHHNVLLVYIYVHVYICTSQVQAASSSHLHYMLC